MDFCIADENRVDVSALTPAAEIDIEIGTDDTNDYEIVIPLQNYNREHMRPGAWFYAIGTEYGGKLSNPESDTSKRTVKFTGDTFRGLLAYRITRPPSGSGYLKLNGTATNVLRQLIGTKFGDLYQVVDGSDALVEAYEVERYVTVLEAIYGALASCGCRLKVQTVYDSDRTFHVELSAVPVSDYSDVEEVSQDANIQFVIKSQTTYYTHILCASRDDSASKTVTIYEVQEDGKAKKVTSIPDGLDSRVYFYDKKGGRTTEKSVLEDIANKFASINKTDTQKANTDSDADVYEIGDILGGRDYVTGIVVAEPITKKIIKVRDGRESVEYKIGE